MANTTYRRSRSSHSMELMEEGGFAVGSEDGDFEENSRSITLSDSWNMGLLILLYAMQGVPLGLSLGSLPFILKTKASYTDIGIFSLAAYPYSLKLLWSPLVDTLYSPWIGWRKSWILPIQIMMGLVMITTAETAERWLDTANIHAITFLFLAIVLLAATQDIAVDGWALTLLSRKNIGHASTCQTVGTNMGYFLSFTIFLALSDASFCNSYLRRGHVEEKGIISLESYFQFWGWTYIIVTCGLFFKAEAPHHQPSDLLPKPMALPAPQSQPTSNFTPSTLPGSLSNRRSGGGSGSGSFEPPPPFHSSIDDNAAAEGVWGPPSSAREGSGNERERGEDARGVMESVTLSWRLDGQGGMPAGQGGAGGRHGAGPNGELSGHGERDYFSFQSNERERDKQSQSPSPGLWAMDEKRAMGGESSVSAATPEQAGDGGWGDPLLPGSRRGNGRFRRTWWWGTWRRWSRGLSWREKLGSRPERGGVGGMYLRLWAVATLPRIQTLSLILLICKIGSITAEAVSVFKLMEKGVPRETISLIVLIEFPLELVFAVFAGRWASKGRPFTPWLVGYAIRLTMAAITTLLVALFPTGASSISEAPVFYLAVVLAGIATSFSSTLMFVAQGTFFARISDSSMGGTYITLLNTISSMGWSWPKFFVFILIDLLTFQRCLGATSPNGEMLKCPSKSTMASFNPCSEGGGTCIKIVDGFYPLSLALIAVGVGIGFFFRHKLQDLELAKDSAWRA